MAKTDLFKEQHLGILEVIQDIKALLVEASLKNNGQAAALALSLLSEKLHAHLSLEDNVLYPVLIGNKNLKAKEIAERFISEMGSIAADYTKYVTTWNAEQIAQTPSTFIDNTTNILAILTKRIHREESELYPLADSM